LPYNSRRQPLRHHSRFCQLHAGHGVKSTRWGVVEADLVLSARENRRRAAVVLEDEG
jgi:hypothetical protein